MSIKTIEELEKLQVVGKIVRKALDRMAAAVRIGITTAELDHVGLQTLTDYGAEAAHPRSMAFPAQHASAWTIRTADRSLSAHYEHTIVITKGAPLLLTA